MYGNRPTLPDPTKLVWTVHYYSFARWWVIVEDRLGFKWAHVAIGTAIGLALSLPALLVCLWRGWMIVQRCSSQDASAASLALGSWLLMLTCGLLVGSLVGRLAYQEAGCEAMALEPDAFDLSAAFTGSFAGVSFSLSLLLFVRQRASQSRGQQLAAGSFMQARRRTAKCDGSAAIAPAPGTAASICIQPTSQDPDPAQKAGSGTRIQPAPPASSPAMAKEECKVSKLGGSPGAPHPVPHACLRKRDRRAGRCGGCNACYCYLNAVFAFCMLSAGGGVLLNLSLKTSSYYMLHDELANKWGLDGEYGGELDAPIFVGEFGEGEDHATTLYWGQMLRFLEEYDLDWAYWPINGDVWNEDDQEWGDEWFGILDRNYSAVRRPAQLADLQRVQ